MKGYAEEEIDSALRLLSGTQHKGITPHSYYMRPNCRTVDLTFSSKAPKGKVNVREFGSPTRRRPL
jgi:hypothetical protein